MNVRVQEAAAYVGLSKSTLDKLRCFGGGPKYFKLGRAVVYSKADLDVWLTGKIRSSTFGAANENILISTSKAA